ncbi:bifunctional phosphopantothenoylcysteine decarboxylase/phosphopantothenate--cysteine ligase CoaBC [Berryella wangjianweii]|uniref:bifunctional phosphopantothenoylcysteine decarboxylase/phosphopantothenate--cysteine ligase CoaBC n=1 Tax=Berryella wangjianweii TaxID=2734634 RepID=UPI0021BD8BF9|nr:bifunctional phosphopantothenoylcysteine decarboxylase/phosphopantothenate--cysteine ligase CoaBC [Berryella wangjianweii]
MSVRGEGRIGVLGEEPGGMVAACGEGEAPAVGEPSGAGDVRAGGLANALAAPGDASASADSRPCVVLGVTACVAIYKACELVRELQRRGMRVKVVMTDHARRFIDPSMFRALTREPVGVGLFDDPSDPIHHISLAKEADVLAIAPCTVNVMAKLAHGLADDLLSTTALACPAPLVIAPAANTVMYCAEVTQANMAALRARGAVIVEADEGMLACGDEGKGRMADPLAVADAICAQLPRAGVLAGRRVLITAGPTAEPIDPVRYVTNRSSGKMGYALARAAWQAGADVTLVSGPVALDAPTGVRVVRVRTAEEMLQACRQPFDECDLAFFCAAVADKRPAAPAGRKLKKGADDAALERIELVDNPDILATLAAGKGSRVVVGFAAETDDVVDNARAKLERKGADLIAANYVGAGGAFGSDENLVVLLSAQGTSELPYGSKDDVAAAIVRAAADMLG